MRGIATGGDGQATTSQPSVGMYLDEQPITTVQGNLDIHMYDIERVEALAGPQGTLYGASSQAGTIRIITNKPDPSAFSAGYAVEGNIVDEDDTGYVVEGYVNVPLTEKAAVRLVGWSREDAGWVDNKFGTRTFTGDHRRTPTTTSRSTTRGSPRTTTTRSTRIGGRAALRVELNDDWVITPALQAQKQESEGSWGDDLSDFAPGDNAVTHFKPEYSDDEWYQIGLTVEGKISNFDIVYSGNYLERDVDASFDYSDYSYFYDAYYTTGYFAGLFFDNNGDAIPPVARYTNNDAYTKQSHELRISSPADKRVRGMLGFFWQKQKHDFQQNFLVEGLADVMLMNSGEANMSRFADTVYLNNVGSHRQGPGDLRQRQLRHHRPVGADGRRAVLRAGELTVKGFFGFGLGFSPAASRACRRRGERTDEPGDPANGGSGAFSPVGQGWSRNGEWRCPSQADYKDAPCLNVDRGIKESEHIGRVNLTWKPADDYMMYATWSEGYRPGGINRNPFVRRLRVRLPDQLGARLEDRMARQHAAVQRRGVPRGMGRLPGLVPGRQRHHAGRQRPDRRSARHRDCRRCGCRSTACACRPRSRTTTRNCRSTYCEDADCDDRPAPDGSPLPLTPEFKGNLIARYEFPLAGFDANVQGAVTYESSRPSDISPDDNDDPRRHPVEHGARPQRRHRPGLVGARAVHRRT